MNADERYIPAFGVRALTPLFDPAVRWLMREAAFKRRLIAQAQVCDGMRVLDTSVPPPSGARCAKSTAC